MGQQTSKGQDLTGLSPNENYFGLHNYGNTCYLNSVLQALYYCLPFRSELLGYHDEEETRFNQGKGKESLLFSLATIFKEIHSHKQPNGVYQPKCFISRLQQQNALKFSELFRGLQHQDAHEFLNYLLNEIADSIQQEKKQNEGDNEQISKPEKTFVHHLFEGLLTNETRCLCCENITSRDETFLDLSIDIEQNTSVTHCLRNFSSVEMMRGSDKFFCNICRSLQEAERRMRVKKVPEILIVHLKRFKYVELNHRHTLAKLSYRVVFPFEIKLPNTSIDTEEADRLYELFAVVIHLGVGGNYGHYICMVKSEGSWIMFDDEQFKKVDPLWMKAYFGSETEDTSNKTCGYLLFYQSTKA